MKSAKQRGGALLIKHGFAWNERAERGKKPCVANCAAARELACWVWAVGCMAEGTM